MRLGIIGFPGAGKGTVFGALTKTGADVQNKRENQITNIKVPDHRVERLSEMYSPKKTTFARVEYFMPGSADKGPEQNREKKIWNQVRDCDALIHVIRNFKAYGMEDPVPGKELLSLKQELILEDLVVVEKRLERVALDKKRGKLINPKELALLKDCLKHLENEIPLRNFPEIAQAGILRGYAFLSAKPLLVLFNNEDDDDHLPDIQTQVQAKAENYMVLRGQLEQELAQMEDEEVDEFLKEFNVKGSAMDRVIKNSYELLGLISFFTVGSDEVRAWTIQKDTVAVDAAETIHSDIKKGFIRAEVLAYDDLIASGSSKAARQKGKTRLEGKSYLVQDGDIINFRFNV